MQGKHLIDIAFIIALMVQMTKLSDLLFNKIQKKTIQNKIEEWTLFLEYINIRKYYPKIFNPQITYFILLLVGTLPFYHFIDNFLIKNDGNIPLLISMVILSYLLFITFGKRLLMWLTKGEFIFFFAKFIILIVPVAIFDFFQFNLDSIFISSNRYVFQIINWTIYKLFFSLDFVLVSIIFYGFCVVLYKAFIEMLILITTFLKWLCWRIVEYNKGAIAAITLLLTFALGIVEVVIKSK